jgi:hypothetical protein
MPTGTGPGVPQAPQPATAGPPPAPAPTHGQTVAALRHFDAIISELRDLLSDPSLGKSNVKSKIIDGMTRLVAGRIVSVADSVAQLQGLPDDPIDQRRWIATHLGNAETAKKLVLTHHGVSHAGLPEEMIDKRASPEDHLDIMQELTSHYRERGKRGRS